MNPMKTWAVVKVQAQANEGETPHPYEGKVGTTRTTDPATETAGVQFDGVDGLVTVKWSDLVKIGDV